MRQDAADYNRVAENWKGIAMPSDHRTERVCPVARCASAWLRLACDFAAIAAIFLGGVQRGISGFEQIGMTVHAAVESRDTDADCDISIRPGVALDSAAGALGDDVCALQIRAGQQNDKFFTAKPAY